MMRLICVITICLAFFSCKNENNQAQSVTEKQLEMSGKQAMNDSVYIEYYDNGNKKVIASIESGKYNGKYIQLHQNGKIFESGSMINGVKNGVWKTYKEEGLLDSVKEYYNGKMLFNLDKSDFSLLPKALEQEKVEISVPINWKTKNGDDPRVLVVSQKKCDDMVVFCPNITLTKEHLKADMDFNSYLQTSTELLQKQLSYFKPVAKGELLIDNLPAFQMTYLMQVNGVKLGGITTWINKENTIYVLTGMAVNEKDSEFLKYKGLFQEITNTFKRY